MKNIIVLFLTIIGIAIAIFGLCAIVEYHFGLEYVALIAIVLGLVLMTYAAIDALKQNKKK